MHFLPFLFNTLANIVITHGLFFMFKFSMSSFFFCYSTTLGEMESLVLSDKVKSLNVTSNFPETPQNSPSKSGEFQSVDLHGEAPLSPPVPSAGGRSRHSSTSSITSDASSLFPIFESPVLNSFSLQVGWKNLTF